MARHRIDRRGGGNPGDRSAGAPRQRGESMKFARKAPVFAALATTSVLLLAACGGSSGGSSGSSPSSGSAGAAITSGFGSIPPASGTAKAGQTINIAQAPNTAPTWIFPVTPAANGSVYTAYQFQYQLWRPLYWSRRRAPSQKIDPTMSVGNTPVWSNGDKTVTITMKTNYKWSNGQPVSSRTCCSSRPAQGGHQGEPGQLGQLHARTSASPTRSPASPRRTPPPWC